MSEALENVLEYEEDTQKGKYLTFIIGKEVYGIEIKYVWNNRHAADNRSSRAAGIY